MEQKEVVHKMYIGGTMTVSKLLQAFDTLSFSLFLDLKDKYRPLEGETGLYKLLGSSEPVTSTLLHEQVKLSTVKKFLEDQGLPFAFKQTSDGTLLYFRVKDQELAKNALKATLNKLAKQPKYFLKTPGTMSFEQRVAYARNSPNYKGKVSVSPVKAPGKGK
jgi:hypothetical protein